MISQQIIVRRGRAYDLVSRGHQVRLHQIVIMSDVVLVRPKASRRAPRTVTCNDIVRALVCAKGIHGSYSNCRRLVSWRMNLTIKPRATDVLAVVPGSSDDY